MATLFTKKNFIRKGLLVLAFLVMVKSDDELTTCDLKNILRSILSPNDLQTYSLRQQLLRLIRQGIEENNSDATNKRSLSSLVPTNNLPYKRNLESLARGGYIKTLDDESDQNLKRSLANLVKKGQLPHYQSEENKRGIESLARNGELHRKRELQELIDELYDKRSIGSIVRDYNFPTYGKRFVRSDLDQFLEDKRNIASIIRNGKRNIGSLVRNNNLPSGKRYVFEDIKRNVAALARDGTKIGGKRNVAALLRQDSYLNGEDKQYSSSDAQTEKPEVESDVSDLEKRNLASLKAQYKPKYKRSEDNGIRRNKRQADYYDTVNEEYSSPVYQNQNIYDYEELLRSLTGEYPDTEKRFLGSVARSGWFRPSSLSRYVTVDKRHIGALARLGWLPALRNARRYQRSGRSASYRKDVDERETSTDGKTENNPFDEKSLPLVESDYLLQPAEMRLLLQKFLMQPSYE